MPKTPGKPTQRCNTGNDLCGGQHDADLKRCRCEFVLVITCQPSVAFVLKFFRQSPQFLAAVLFLRVRTRSE